MPEVLAGVSEATITTWAVAEGDRFETGTMLAEIETDKAVVDYAAEEEGWIGRLLVPNGATVEVGEPIAVVLESEGESADDVAGLPAAGAGGRGAPSPGDAAPVDGTTEPLVAGPAAAGTTPGAPVETGSPAASGAGGVATGGEVAEFNHTVGEKRAGEQKVGEKKARGRDGARIFASPLARKLAREHGLTLDELDGTGPNGRIVRADVERAVAARSAAPAAATQASPAAAVAATEGGGVVVAEYEEIPHSRMRKAIARRLTESKSSVPHFYVKAECRVDELLALRARVNETSPVKISVNDFVLKAVAAAFAEVPEANVVWTEEAMRRYSRVDVAVAVSTETDLVTPVVRDVAALSLSRLALTVRDLAERARAKQLRQHELEGGTFTVSNLGMFGVTEFSAILNPPHSGILAVGAARPEPVVVDGQVEVAQVMTCVLSADHRAVDGALAARWISAFQKAIENPYGLLV